MSPLRKSPTQFVVGSIIAAALIATAYTLTGPLWGSILTLAGLYEAWTLINRFPNDTISEILWEYAKRPFVPWLFGLAVGWALESGFISDRWLALAVGFLCGHFFFQRQGDEGMVR